jgi:pimeloyl-ACP methyl ester carboxylesterase
MTAVDQPENNKRVDSVADVRIETLSVAGLNTVVRLVGRPRAEAVVFVHGFLGSGADFQSLLEDVGQVAYAVAPDLPNFGRSQRSGELSGTVQGYADHLAAVLADLGIERVHLVLHDFGGPWGMQWAADHPEAVASVTLFNIGVMPGYRWHPYARAWRTPILGELMMACMPRPVFRRLMQREQPRSFPPAFLDRIFDDIDAGLKRAGLRLYRATSDWGALSVQLGDKLAALRLPALVIWGDADRNLPAKYAAEQTTYFAVQNIHVLAGCGHWPFIDEPARCSEHLLAFLKCQLSRSAPRSS